MTKWWDRLNGALVPYIGPPPLGPYNEPPQPAVSTRACPLCGSTMQEHVFDRAAGRPTYVRCPV